MNGDGMTKAPLISCVTLLHLSLGAYALGGWRVVALGLMSLGGVSLWFVIALVVATWRGRS
jgi:hypothetical protein